MKTPIIQSDTVNKLRFAVDAALAMLAGAQLDVFTPLKNGPMTAEEVPARSVWSLGASGSFSIA